MQRCLVPFEMHWGIQDAYTGLGHCRPSVGEVAYPNYLKDPNSALRPRQNKVKQQNLKASQYVLSVQVLHGNVIGEGSGDGGVIHLPE